MSDWNAWKDYTPDPATVVRDTSKPGTRQKPATGRTTAEPLSAYPHGGIVPQNERQTPAMGDEATPPPAPFTINQIRSVPAVVDDAWPWSGMNGTEKRFAREFLHGNARVIEWHFESINLRLGEGLFYRPDFFVVMDDGRRRIVEVKGGYVREDAEVKFKAAALRYTLLGYFEMWQYTKKSGWVCIREI